MTKNFSPPKSIRNIINIFLCFTLLLNNILFIGAFNVSAKPDNSNNSRDSKVNQLNKEGDELNDKLEKQKKSGFDLDQMPSQNNFSDLKSHDDNDNFNNALCREIAKVDKLIKYLQAIRNSNNATQVDALLSLAFDLRNRLLELDTTGKCGGKSLEPVKVKEKASDNAHYAASLSFDNPNSEIVRKMVGDQEMTFTKLTTGQGEESQVGEAGQPQVPVWRSLIAIPEGSQPQVVVTKKTTSMTVDTLLIPYQPQAMDQSASSSSTSTSTNETITPPDPSTFADPIFVYEPRIYQTNSQFPGFDCRVMPIGDVRDVHLAQIECATGSYNPVTKKLVLYSGLEFQVNFLGGTGKFYDKKSTGEFDNDNLYSDIVLNSSVVSKYLGNIIWQPICIGEEYLILTHPNFKTSADKLAVWKNAKGITTRVAVVNDGAGPGPDTAAQIDTYIENEYHNCLTRPSYVLLLGDAEYIPTFYVSTSGSATTGSDNQYSMIGSADALPDIAVGRMPVDTLAQADVIVDKTIAYEKTPPMVSSFYANATVVSHFQCCNLSPSAIGTEQRTFVQVSEFVRNTLIAAGKTVDRVYVKTNDPAYTGDTTPRRFNDGTLLPAAIGGGSGFPWNGNTTNIISEFNAGKFLIVHRDHGWQDGWANPGFTKANVPSLTNGNLTPIVYSVNCASGFFDNETAGGDYGTTAGAEYFTEALLRKSGGGAVGVLGDTRNSPSWPNSRLLEGFIDATWPTAIPTFGTSASKKRLGDILNHGKLYMVSQIGVAGSGVDTSSANSELYLWHTFGDPTLTMRTAMPIALPVGSIYTVSRTALNLKYATNNAVITASQIDTQTGEVTPIARASVVNGNASLPFMTMPNPALPIQLSACIDNAICTQLSPVPGTPVTGPQ